MNHEMIEPKVTAIMNELVTTKKQYQIDPMSGNFYSQNDIVDVLRSALATLPEPAINLWEALELLKEDYERRLKSVMELIQNDKNNGSINDIRRHERFMTKQSEYRILLVELNKITLSHLEAKEGRG